MVELQLRCVLDVVRIGVLVAWGEEIVEAGEHPLRGNRVGRVRQHSSEHEGEFGNHCLVRAPEVHEVEFWLHVVFDTKSLVDQDVVLVDLCLHFLCAACGVIVRHRRRILDTSQLLCMGYYRRWCAHAPE